MNAWRDIWADLRVHPGRTVLTAVSLFLGVVAVMAIVATGDVVREVFVAQAEQQGGRLQTFERTVALPPSAGKGDLVAAIGHLPAPGGADAACRVEPSSGLQVALTAVTSPLNPRQGAAGAITPVIVCGDYRAIYRLPLSQGRWLADDQATAPYEAVLNRPAATQYGGPGTTLWLVGDATPTAFPVRVVGVVNDGASTPNLYTGAVPWLANAPQLVTAASVTLLWRQTPATDREIKAATDDWLIDHGLPTDSVVMETDQVAQYREFIALLQWAFAGVAVLSLAVAALGIVNVGLASVRERAHELVIRRALGASTWSIVRMIMGSALLLSVIVAAAAATAVWGGLAAFRATLAYDSPVTPPVYPAHAAALGVGVSVLTALVGSLVPGLVAARLQPGLALRD